MSSSICLRCLTRAVNRIEISTPINLRSAAFSTSQLYAAAPKKAVAGKTDVRKGKSLRLSKNTRASTGRRPDPGERKALRKRIVLSNSNAIEVQGLDDLTAVTSSSARLRELQGKVLGLSNNTVDTLRALDAFKPTQRWSLFWRPTTLITKDTVNLAADLDSARTENGNRVVRKILYGKKGVGKSVLQLQALAMAQLKGWIVIHVPEAQELTIGHTSYQPIQTEEGTLYIQPHYTSKLLENIGKANESVLSGLQLSQEHKLPIPIQSNISLARFTELGAKDPELAWPVWKAFWKELQTVSPDGSDKPTARPPVLFTLDGADHIMRTSSYLNSEVQPIHAHDLALVRDFVDLLSGRTSLPNGGVILGAVSESNRPAAPSFRQSLARSLAAANGKTPSPWDPYVAHDDKVRKAMETVTVQNLEGLAKDEARGIMEYYARSGVLRTAVTDSLVSETWTIAGGGIIGELERGSVEARF